jgi:hypothetical protein
VSEVNYAGPIPGEWFYIKKLESGVLWRFCPLRKLFTYENYTFETQRSPTTPCGWLMRRLLETGDHTVWMAAGNLAGEWFTECMNGLPEKLLELQAIATPWVTEERAANLALLAERKKQAPWGD